MTQDVHVLSFAPALPAEMQTGLLGWVRLAWGALVLDSITLRRTRSGRLALGFPARTDSDGNKHAYFRPIDDASRRAIEAAVFAQLGITEEVAP